MKTRNRIPRKLKKAFKVLVIGNCLNWSKKPLWKTTEVRIDVVDKHYVHWKKVPHINHTALIQNRLIPK